MRGTGSQNEPVGPRDSDQWQIAHPADPVLLSKLLQFLLLVIAVQEEEEEETSRAEQSRHTHTHTLVAYNSSPRPSTTINLYYHRPTFTIAPLTFDVVRSSSW